MKVDALLTNRKITDVIGSQIWYVIEKSDSVQTSIISDIRRTGMMKIDLIALVDLDHGNKEHVERRLYEWWYRFNQLCIYDVEFANE